MDFSKLKHSKDLYIVLNATGLLSIILYAVESDSYSIIPTYTVIWLIGYLLFRKVNFQLFTLSYSINCSIAVLFAIILKINTGESFLGGGDDKHFYNSALEIFHGMELVRSNHPLYHYINMLILNISYNLGLKDLSFVNLIIGNAFIGSTIPIAVNIIAKRLVSDKVRNATIYFMVFFPLLFVHSSILLRDIWIAAIFVWSIIFVINDKLSFSYKFIITFLFAFISFNFRPVNSVYPLVLLFSYYFFSIKSKNLKYFLFFGILMPATLLAVGLVLNEAIRVYTIYTGLATTNSSEGSLGMMFIKSTNPVIKLIYSVIVLYNPIPPFPSFKIYNLFIGVGAILWYVIVPGFLLGLIKAIKDPLKRMSIFALSFGSTFIAIMMVLSMMFSAARHKTLIYPIGVLFFFYYIFNSKRAKIYNIYALYCLLGVLAVFTYIGLKIWLSFNLE